MKNLTFWYNILTSQVILAKKKVTKFKNQQANTKYYLHVLTYSTNVHMNSPPTHFVQFNHQSKKLTVFIQVNLYLLNLFWYKSFWSNEKSLDTIYLFDLRGIRSADYFDYFRVSNNRTYVL